MNYWHKILRRQHRTSSCRLNEVLVGYGILRAVKGSQHQLINCYLRIKRQPHNLLLILETLQSLSVIKRGHTMLVALKSKDSESKRDPSEPEKKRRDKTSGSGTQNMEHLELLGTKTLDVADPKQRGHLRNLALE